MREKGTPLRTGRRIKIKELSISGFRGFGEKQKVCFSLPDGITDGSGLSIITGANNSGKTTIIESIRAFNGAGAPSISEGKRNVLTNGVVQFELTDEKEKNYTISSIQGGEAPLKIVNYLNLNSMFFSQEGAFLLNFILINLIKKTPLRKQAGVYGELFGDL